VQQKSTASVREKSEELARAVAAGDKQAVARALNLVEDRRPQAQPSIAAMLSALSLKPETQRVGLTGPPGVGKSTLTSALALEWRRHGHSVAVLAVDPSSVRSGGALLGDRVRMAFDPSDQKLFVRSLATAGDTGGLAQAAGAVVEVFSASFDRVLVETVGVGQSETAVEHVVDTVCLVVQPGSGDALQFIKAGIMEIPDVIVVNKGDHKLLAERAAGDLRGALASLRRAGMQHSEAEWRVPVLVTSARDRTGIEELAQALDEHRQSFTVETLARRRRAGTVAWSLALLTRRYGEHGLEALGGAEVVRERIGAELDLGEPSVGVVASLGVAALTKLRGI
jgi:LAO/AO transport system kinase